MALIASRSAVAAATLVTVSGAPSNQGCEYQGESRLGQSVSQRYRTDETIALASRAPTGMGSGTASALTPATATIDTATTATASAKRGAFSSTARRSKR